MTKNKIFSMISMPTIMAVCSVFAICDFANAAPRTAVRGTAMAARKSVTASVQNIETPTQEITEPETTTEEIFVANKSNQFDVMVNEVIDEASDDNTFAAEIRRQRAALAASESTTAVKSAMQSGTSTCDSGLRKCMMETCGNDFTKCALDGDTVFGEKLNKCKNTTTCSAHDFGLFSKEIKDDRDMNVRLASYEKIISCGNQYNACIVNECGTTYNKCLGKTNADAAIEKCKAIANECKESDSGLANRFGTAIGLLRGNAEKSIATDEKQLYTLRDSMRNACTSLGATFDERSFDCVYTVNFFAGDNQNTPTASRKGYAGDSFVCMQEWFGINATTFKENAYRETRSQTAASSAMLGSGLGTAAGLITSGAIGRALETQKAKKELQAECALQGGTVVNGKCHTAAEAIEKATSTGLGTLTAPSKGTMKAAGEEINATNAVIDPLVQQSDKVTNTVDGAGQALQGVAEPVMDGVAAYYTKGASAQTSVEKNKLKAQVKAKEAERENSKSTHKKGMVCTNAKEHHLLATYDDNNNCVVKSCVAGYTKKDNKCVPDAKLQAKIDACEGADSNGTWKNGACYCETKPYTKYSNGKCHQ